MEGVNLVFPAMPQEPELYRYRFVHPSGAAGPRPRVSGGRSVDVRMRHPACPARCTR